MNILFYCILQDSRINSKKIRPLKRTCSKDNASHCNKTKHSIIVPHVMYHNHNLNCIITASMIGFV